ncbi:acyl-CoA hydrolase [Clostridium sp. WLY-B-L2]|uniref:Acyl-CoA hydrolase n=1 Tax=Clostridium aromativorans TaxID=2836848 RepID=A0ABS8N8E4_9CLOT|nr:acyl-CoA hydrolase [Clostridium aromativorans]MCC9296059.1 acyl-CoA hydrolase [Clostridium aromativorans]
MESIKTYSFRYRMSSKDEFYGGGIVNGSRSITLMGDLADSIASKKFGNIGRCKAVPNVRLFYPVHAGDYMEFVGRIIESKENEITIECRSYIVITKPEDAPFESSVDVLENPILSTVAIFKYESRK